MKLRNKEELVEIEEKIFDIKDQPLPRGAWWWWMWLFFFNNPKNPERPRQLLLLLSTKNLKEIYCNNLKFILKQQSKDKNNLLGAVASWYFDGEKMNHNFLLEQCNINFSENCIISNSSVPTYFSKNKNLNTIKIGNDFEFLAEEGEKKNFTKPYYRSNTIGKRGYTIIESDFMKLKGRIKREPINGSAYFQRVFIKMPFTSWYWGVFHFENGGVLTYLRPYVARKSIKNDISFFDGKEIHKFKKINIKRVPGDMPKFIVKGEKEDEKITFTVNAYSHSSWTFKKKFFGLIPNKLVYNEYPSVVSEFKLIKKKTGEKITLEDLGKSVGNAEHGTGLLL
jgi:hypothetical protein